MGTAKAVAAILGDNVSVISEPHDATRGWSLYIRVLEDRAQEIDLYLEITTEPYEKTYLKEIKRQVQLQLERAHRELEKILQNSCCQ